MNFLFCNLQSISKEEECTLDMEMLSVKVTVSGSGLEVWPSGVLQPRSCPSRSRASQLG